MIEPGAVLGHYEIVGPVGAGGMGEVYAARDTHLDRTVAVKVLPEAVARSRTARERFEREAKTLAGVSHSNILSIYDFATEDGTYFAVTEMLDGETLRQRLKRDGPLPLEEALRIAKAVASGLAAAHEKHIVHRDIKPSNLFLQNGGGVKILDFGLARWEAPVREGMAGEAETMAETLPETLPEPTSPGTILGTIGYLSPEQARGETVTIASDVFSFGCVLYEMLTGEAPFARPSKVEMLSAILRDEPRSPAELGRPLPAPVAAILRRCLAKDTAQRYGSGVELHRDLVALGTHREKEERRHIAVAVVATALLATVIAGFFGYGAVKRRANERWARQEALPEIQRLIREESYAAALELTERALGFLPDDAALVALADECSTTLTVTTEPSGARVLIKDYSDVEGEWRLLGTTPIEEARLPAGVYRSRIEKEGYMPRELATRLMPPTQRPQLDPSMVEGPFDQSDPSLRPLDVALDPVGSVPEEMVAVEAGIYSAIPLVGFTILGGVELGRYLIDRHEVSNRDFQDFVDGGGYESPEHWQEPFVLDGRTLSWSEAMTRFRDTSDRAGPAGWILGRPPEGEEDLPVSGVSWYEAAAYARFRKKSLPTLYHWVRAVLPSWESVSPLSPSLLPLSNIGGSGPAPVGSHSGLGVAGTYDMAGNVREWAANGRGELRATLGGAWSDPDYFFQSAYAESAWDRLPTNGFRCVRYLDDPPPEELLALPELPQQDFAVAPFSDEVYATLRNVYSYDRGPLRAEMKAHESLEWAVDEWIEIDTAYGERMPLRLFLPETAAPPYQVVVFHSGLDMLLSRSSLIDETGPGELQHLLDLVRGGRALLLPALAGTYDRNDGTSFHTWTTSQAGRGELIDLWRKDLRRVLDYVEEREDLDAERAAFLGLSLGGELMPHYLAFEPRFRAALVWSAGFWRLWPQSRVDEMAGLLHRVRQPVLMLGGRYDFVFPEPSQRQFFELLGTPPEARRLVLYETGHWPLPRGEVAKECLGWLDRWFGPVRTP